MLVKWDVIPNKQSVAYWQDKVNSNIISKSIEPETGPLKKVVTAVKD